jgi:hypothetical protein
MKQYESIWIDPMGKIPSKWDELKQIQGPLICMTLEELREVYDLGKSIGEIQGDGKYFENFITSKGIKL